MKLYIYIFAVISKTIFDFFFFLENHSYSFDISNISTLRIQVNDNNGIPPLNEFVPHNSAYALYVVSLLHVLPCTPYRTRSTYITYNVPKYVVIHNIVTYCTHHARVIHVQYSDERYFHVKGFRKYVSHSLAVMVISRVDIPYILL